MTSCRVTVMWADVSSESADISRKPMNDGQITWRRSIMLRPKSRRPRSPSTHRQTEQHIHATLPHLLPFPRTYQATAQQHKHGVDVQKQSRELGRGWGGWSCMGKVGEAEVEVDPKVRKSRLLLCVKACPFSQAMTGFDSCTLVHAHHLQMSRGSRRTES